MLKYNPLSGIIVLEFDNEKNFLIIDNVESCLMLGKKSEELVLKSVVMRKQKKSRELGDNIDFYYNIKMCFSNNYQILARGTVNINQELFDLI